MPMKRHLLRGLPLLVLVSSATALAQPPSSSTPSPPLEALPPPPPPTPTPTPNPAPSTTPPTTADFGAGGPAAPPPQDVARAYVPPPKSDEEIGRTFRPSGLVEGGYQYQQIHGVPITGGRLRLGVGGQNDSQAHYAVLSILYGSTEESLRSYDVRLGWNGDFLRKSIFRLGGQVELGYLWIKRTTIDKRMWALGIGGGIHASADVLQFGARDDHALYVEGRFDVHAHFGPAFIWAPSLLVGFRY